MKLTIDIPDNIATSVVDNICLATQFNTNAGMTKAAWAKKVVLEQMKQMVRMGATIAARQAAVATVDTTLKATPIT